MCRLFLNMIFKKGSDDFFSYSFYGTTRLLFSHNICILYIVHRALLGAPKHENVEFYISCLVSAILKNCSSQKPKTQKTAQLKKPQNSKNHTTKKTAKLKKPQNSKNRTTKKPAKLKKLQNSKTATLPYIF